MSTTDEKTLVISDFRTLPAYQNAKETQESLIKNHPFVPISDMESFKLAKKARTALRQGRYDLQNGKKLILSKLNDFKKDVDEETKKLIDITIGAEEKQQTEVERWEAEVQEKKEEAKRQEQERIDKIRNLIIDFRLKKTDEIRKATIETIREISNSIEFKILECAEFEQDFELVKDQLLDAAKEKQEQLKEAERVRVENERLVEEKKNLEAERKKMEEQRRKEEAELKAERDKLFEQQRQIKLQKEKEAEAERQRQIKELRKKEAVEIKRRTVQMQQIGYEFKDNQFVFGNVIIDIKEVAGSAQFYECDLPKFERIIEGEINRIEALKPDKEKLTIEIDKHRAMLENLSLNDEVSKELQKRFVTELNEVVQKYLIEVSNL